MYIRSISVELCDEERETLKKAINIINEIIHVIEQENCNHAASISALGSCSFSKNDLEDLGQKLEFLKWVKTIYNSKTK